MSTSADLGISYIAGQQAQPEITHNTALNQIQILQTGVISVALNTPPGSPAQGDSYIIGASPTGAWAGRANCLAGYFGTAWVFVPGVDSNGTNITMGARHEGLKVYSKADNALYVWSGSAWATLAGGMTNPMTTAQDLIVGGASGTPGRLAIGTNGFVLTAVAGAVAWAAATGFANPMTTSGDIIIGGASGVATRLAAGTNGHVLTLTAGVPTWAAVAGGMTNPMTTTGDLIYGGASGVPTRLAAGTNTHVLTLAGGVPTWAAPSGGGGGSITVQDEGSTLTTAVTKFNFVGAGVTVTEPVADEVTVTITGASASPGTPPTIVQTAISNAASTSITLAAAPTNGNLLVAICQSGSAAQGSGWTLQSSNSTGIFWGVVATKVAGAGESATQTPIATAGSGPVIMMWEIAGAAASPVIVASADFRVAAVNGSSTLVPAIQNTLILFGLSLEATGVAFTYKANYTEDRNLTSGFNASMGHADASLPVYGALLVWASSTSMRPSYIMLKS